MTQNKNQNLLYTQTQINLYGYAMSNSFSTSGFKQIDPKNFDSNKYSSNSSKGCYLEVDFECPKELLLITI